MEVGSYCTLLPTRKQTQKYEEKEGKITTNCMCVRTK